VTSDELSYDAEGSTEMKVSLIVPTFNERENLEELASRVFAAFNVAGVRGEIVLVDDSSPDGTYSKAEELSKQYEIKIISRPARLSLSSAAIDGFRAATGDIVGVMDADLSHRPESIPDLLAPLIDGESEMTIGSRHVDGGSIDSSWPISRKIISRVAAMIAKPLTNIRDPMSGYFFVTREVLRRGEDKLNPAGQKILLDILVNCRPEKITEVPITFAERRMGKSKMSLKTILRYSLQIWNLYNRSGATPARYVKFMIVGAIGTAINLIVFWLLTGYLPELFFEHDRFLIASFIAFMVAVTNNFLLNSYWAFPDRRGIIHIQYGQFVIASLGGLAINEVMLKLMIDAGFHHMLSQFIGILMGSSFNFIVNLKWTFSLRASLRGRNARG